MTDTLRIIIEESKKTPNINSNPDLGDCLTKIEKYSQDEKEKAYFFGQFFRHKFDSNNLPDDTRKLLKSGIKASQLESYYYSKQQPEKNHFDIFSLIPKRHGSCPHEPHLNQLCLVLK